MSYAHGDPKPVRMAVVGMVHDHVHWILGRQNRGDIEIVGYVEPNRELAQKMASRYGFDMAKVYSTLEELVSKTKPEAVLAFNTIYAHLEVVEFCAPRGIHVMVEKPLAVNDEHAQKMLALARKHNIFLLTNYETTWYASNEKAHELVKDNKLGNLRKMVFYTGHRGPREIGCSEEFLAWLTDPVLNGAGALNDFGCYGADIATWMMKGSKPVSVSAIIQQNKPAIYPKVDDEATIVVRYPEAQVVIQASWNWPYNRKEMEVYGTTGYVFCPDGKTAVYRADERSAPQNLSVPDLPKEKDDPFIYFANVIRGNITMEKWAPSAPETNEMVVRILEAARISASSGKTVIWNDHFRDN